VPIDRGKALQDPHHLADGLNAALVVFYCLCAARSILCFHCGSCCDELTGVYQNAAILSGLRNTKYISKKLYGTHDVAIELGVQQQVLNAG
jgi:hypothetical protein